MSQDIDLQQLRNCIEITISNDLTVEMDETFHISLERLSDHGIVLNPAYGVVTIIDDDGKSVFER